MKNICPCAIVSHKWGYEVDNVTEFHSSAFPSFYTVITCMKISLCSLSLSWNSCIITCIIIVLSILPLWFCLAHRSTLSVVRSDWETYRIGRCIATVIKRLTVPLLSTVEMEYVRDPAEKKCRTLPTCTLQTSVCVSPCALELGELGKTDATLSTFPI